MDVSIACLCPAKPDGSPRHESDTVSLRDKLDFRQATAIRNEAMVAKVEDPEMSVGETLAVLTEGYLVQGVQGWSLVDARGKPLPITKQAVRDVLLGDIMAAAAVGEVADALYGESVVLPLLGRVSSYSPPTPTDGSTSATNGTPPKPRKRSRPSSTTTTPTGGTGPTGSLLAGGSS